MNKYFSVKTLIEFAIFNCLILFLGRSILPDIDFSTNITTFRTLMLLSAAIVYPNVAVISLLITVYIFNKVIFKRSTPDFIERMLLYSLASFVFPLILTGLWLFLISGAGIGSGGESLTFFGAMWNALSSWALNIFQEALDGKLNIFSLCTSVAILLIPYCISSWCISGVLCIIFISNQLNEFKEKRLTAIILFISLKISFISSKIIVACAGVSLLTLGLTALFAPILYNFWNLIALRQSGSLFIWLVLVVWSWITFSSIIVFSIPPLAIVVRLLSSFSNRSDIYKVIHTCVWKVYFPVVTTVQLKVVPLTIFSPISIFTHSIILNSLISFQECSLFIIDEVQIAESLTDFTVSYVMARQKWLFSGNKLAFFVSKLESLQIVARQMLLMGNIKQAEKLYGTLLILIEHYNLNGKRQKLDNLSSLQRRLDIVFKELIEFYIRLNQKENVKTLYLKTSEYLANQNLSLISTLSIQMTYKFYMDSDIEDFELGQHSSQINYRKVSELVHYLIAYSPNSQQINKPEDLNKWLLYIFSDESEVFGNLFKRYMSRLSELIAEIKGLFVVQEKIFALAKGQSCDYILTIKEIERAMSEVLDFNILGIKLSFSNPFINENYILVPLILAESSLDFSLEVINSLTDRAIVDKRTFDLALLYCCQGKILVDCDEVNTGFSLLCNGICLFEGIRNSVSSDRLGIGFGDGYLKFYDWAIDAAIQVGDIHQAFDYSEHAKARAMLDLLCQRTSSSASGALQENLVELQNLDLSIALVDSSTYSKPSYADLLPSNLQEHLRSRFYNRKESRLQDIHKKRSNIIHKIDKIDSVASSLIIFKPLSWTKKSIFGDYIATYDELWKNHCTTSSEAIISYHGLCNSQFTSKRQWSKIICFYLFIEEEEIRLSHSAIDELSIVNQLQAESQELIEGIYLQSRKSNLSLDSISEKLIQPILRNLPGDLTKLVIMGNDEFQFIPWSAMRLEEDEDSDEERRLVDDFRIRVTPSLSLLFLLKEREERRDSIIPSRFSIVGVSRYPETQHFLYWSGFEVESIAKLHSTKPIKDRAIDTQFVDEFHSSEIIHFSGHANYQVDESLNALERTYLCLYHQQLSAAQILDGALQSSTAKAMILSACLTGRGDLIGAGSEILGLERSLFSAGLSALITTLWQVDEISTSLLMIKFHSLWKQHDNSLDCLSSSLADAQIWLKNASLRDLKDEIEGFDNALEKCIEVCSILIDRELTKNTEADIESLTRMRQRCIKMKQNDDNNIPFYHPRHWAAFQVKGVG